MKLSHHYIAPQYFHYTFFQKTTGILEKSKKSKSQKLMMDFGNFLSTETCGSGGCSFFYFFLPILVFFSCTGKNQG